MRKVLHVGPCNTPGGMAKVIEILSENPPEGWAAETLNSHSHKGIYSKLVAWRKAKKFLAINFINDMKSSIDWLDVFSWWAAKELNDITNFTKTEV